MTHLVTEITKTGKRVLLSVSDELYDRHYRHTVEERAKRNQEQYNARQQGMDWGEWARQVVEYRSKQDERNT